MDAPESTSVKRGLPRSEARRWRFVWRRCPPLAKVTFIAGLGLLATSAVLELLHVTFTMVMGFTVGGILLGLIVTSVIRAWHEEMKGQ